MAQDTSGASWTRDLPLTPKKPQVFEDKVGSTPLKFNHKLDEVIQKMRPRRQEIADSESDSSDDTDDEFAAGDVLLSRNINTPKKTYLLLSSQSSVEETPEKKLADFMAIIKDSEDTEELVKMENDARNLYKSPSRKASEKFRGQALLDEAVKIVKDEDDGGDSDTEQHYAKLRQAMDRQAAGHTAPNYYFFTPVSELTISHEPPTPGPAHPQQFNLSIQSKLATKYPVRDDKPNLPGFVLPDELIVWILDTFPTQRSEPERAEYLQILTNYEKQVGRLLREEQLKRLFISIGADKQAVEHGRQANAVAQREAPKTGRDWAQFYNAMQLLRHCCGWMDVDPLIHAAVFLLRASMDGEVRLRADVSTVVNDTLAILVAACQPDYREKFCRKVCNLFMQTVDSVNLLSRALEATHHVQPQSPDTELSDEDFEPFNDLRTRLQLSVFFNDAEKARPDYCGTAPLLLQSILDRLDDKEFKGGRSATGRGSINYYDLDGYGLALIHTIPFLHYLRERLSRAEQVQLGEGIEDLRRKVSYINSTIQIIGSMEEIEARHDAKRRWQTVDRWLSHFFPKRGAGAGHFGYAMTDEEAEAQRRVLETQQRFMARFTKNRADGVTIKQEPEA